MKIFTFKGERTGQYFIFNKYSKLLLRMVNRQFQVVVGDILEPLAPACKHCVLSNTGCELSGKEFENTTSKGIYWEPYLSRIPPLQVKYVLGSGSRNIARWEKGYLHPTRITYELIATKYELNESLNSASNPFLLPDLINIIIGYCV